jgi:hypothetical protein
MAEPQPSKLVMRVRFPSPARISPGQMHDLAPSADPRTAGDSWRVWTEVALQQTITNWWNHGVGEIITSLLGAGLRITGFVEVTSSPPRVEAQRDGGTADQEDLCPLPGCIQFTHSVVRAQRPLRQVSLLP